uniref:Uncharacterized protein n=1 Tax=Brassica oleracea TaxID=3712 RepID=A0A3P6D212_BRAOL|nr:unnamed protein product [Brassica oleracea]
MESGQLPELELPEPPDFPSSPVRASLFKRSSATVEVFISSSPFYFVGVSISNRPFTTEEVSIVSFHLPALTPSTESFLNLDLDLGFFQVPVYFNSRILRPSISSMTSTSGFWSWAPLIQSRRLVCWCLLLGPSVTFLLQCAVSLPGFLRFVIPTSCRLHVSAWTGLPAGPIPS